MALCLVYGRPASDAPRAGHPRQIGPRSNVAVRSPLNQAAETAVEPPSEQILVRRERELLSIPFGLSGT